MKLLFAIVFSYLSGSILYSYLLPKLFLSIDIIKASEDGNPGAYNAFVYGGTFLGIFSVLLDLMKGFLPVYFILKQIPNDSFFVIPVLLAPVLGHAFSIFFKGHGGKCIAVSFGVLLGLAPNFVPVLSLAVLYLVFSLVIVIRPNYYRSVITFGIFSLFCLFIPETIALKIAGMVISAIVIFKHREKYQGERLQIKVPLFLPKS